MFSKESEEERRKEFLTPYYSESSKRGEDEEDLDEIGITDDDDDLDDIDDIEDDDPEEEEKVLEIRETLPEVEDDLPFGSVSQPTRTVSSPKPFFQPQQNQQQMAGNGVSSWPSGGSGGFWNQGTQNQQTPWGQSGNNNPWNRGNSGWQASGNGGSTWGHSNPNQQAEVLNRQKKVIICDVLDCLICTQDGTQRLGIIPRDIWDIMPRFDVWLALRRFGYIERIYALIPKSLMSNNDDYEDWIATLNWLSRALARFLRIDKNCVQIITPAYISQPKREVVDSVLRELPREEMVYIGTQSGFQGQSSIDVDCANSLEIDYIDLGRFLTIYS